jgi:hypothetical protein
MGNLKRSELIRAAALYVRMTFKSTERLHVEQNPVHVAWI